LPPEPRAVVFFARAVVLLLLLPELPERERADAVRPPRDRDELARVPAERDDREDLEERDEVADVLRPRAEVRELVRFRPDERELFAEVERERVPELRRALVERPRACVDRLRLPLLLRSPDSFDCAVARPTSLLKRLSEPSSNSKAKPLSSNLRKKSSQEISSRLPSPLYPGKSMRRMPGSPPCSVAITAAGTPPRSSAHRRISS
jgi:hypothetical protein